MCVQNAVNSFQVVLKALDPNFHIESPFDPTIQGLEDKMAT